MQYWEEEVCGNIKIFRRVIWISLGIFEFFDELNPNLAFPYNFYSL